MITFRIPPLPRRKNLRRHTPLPPLLINLLRDLLCNLLLLGVVVEDSAAVLCSYVGALPVLGRRVVHLVEEFEEGAVGEFGG